MHDTNRRRTKIKDAEECSLLAWQLLLIETKREEVLARSERGGVVLWDDDLANDLVGARLVILAALLAGGLTEAEREGLERSEREATALLREVLAGHRGR